MINFKQNYLVIELTNNCLLSCTHCIQQFNDHAHFKKKGFIKKELIDDLFEDLKKNGMKFDALILFWLGEPLLHPQFGEIYKRILSENKKHNLFNKIEVHTNGYLLNDETISIIFRYTDVVQRWHFSLDAVTKETYQKIKNRDYYDKVLSNIKKLVNRKSEEKSKYPQLVFQFIIEKENSKEAKLFSDYWKNYLNSLGIGCKVYSHFIPDLDKDCVFFRQLDCMDRASQEEANKLYKKVLEEIKVTTPTLLIKLQQILRPKKARICSGPWKNPVINWKGDVTVCTNDCELKLAVGNIKKQDLSKMWWENKKLGTLRRTLIKNQLKGLTCHECIIPKSNNYTGITEKELNMYKKWADRNG